MNTEDVIAYIRKLEAKGQSYEDWHSARKLVIDYLTQKHGLTDQYQWAYKTIELLQELEKLKKQS